MQKTMLKCSGDSTAKKPDDFVIATGEAYSVKQFIDTASKVLNFKIIWKGKGLQEQGYL